MSILLVGSRGNMGTRYAACLDFLQQEHVDFDLGMTHPEPSKYDKILIATPTETHLSLLEHYAKEDKPILVEKPIVKTSKDLDKLKALLKKNDQIYMVNQYAYNSISVECEIGTSFYNYFRHGADGLIWDCIQIIALACGDVSLGETSPIWQCQINGIQYHQDRMDEYYIGMIADFCGEQKYLWGQDEIIKAHEKVLEYEKDYHRNPSTKYIDEIAGEGESIN